MVPVTAAKIEDVLGKATTDSSVQCFMQQLGKLPRRQQVLKGRYDLEFLSLGLAISIYSEPQPDHIGCVFLFFGRPGTKRFRPFTGTLPNGISITDTRHVVMKKMPIEPSRSGSFVQASLARNPRKSICFDRYDFENHYWVFDFTQKDQVLFQAQVGIKFAAEGRGRDAGCLTFPRISGQ